MFYHIYLLSNCVDDPNVVKIESSNLANKLEFEGVLVLYRTTESEVKHIESEIISEFKKHFKSTKYGNEYFCGQIQHMTAMFSDIINKHTSKQIITPVTTTNPHINSSALLFTGTINKYTTHELEIIKKKENSYFDMKLNYPDKINMAKLKIINELYDISKKQKYTIIDFNQIVGLHIKLGYLSEFYKINNIEHNLSIERTSLESLQNIITSILRPQITQELKLAADSQFTKTIIKNHIDLITEFKDINVNPYQLIEYLQETNQIQKTLFNDDIYFAHNYLHDIVFHDIKYFKDPQIKIKMCIITATNIRILIKKLDVEKDSAIVNNLYKYLHEVYKLLGQLI